MGPCCAGKNKKITSVLGILTVSGLPNRKYRNFGIIFGSVGSRNTEFELKLLEIIKVGHKSHKIGIHIGERD